MKQYKKNLVMVLFQKIRIPNTLYIHTVLGIQIMFVSKDMNAKYILQDDMKPTIFTMSVIPENFLKLHTNSAAQVTYLNPYDILSITPTTHPTFNLHSYFQHYKYNVITDHPHKKQVHIIGSTSFSYSENYSYKHSMCSHIIL